MPLALDLSALFQSEEENDECGSRRANGTRLKDLFPEQSVC